MYPRHGPKNLPRAFAGAAVLVLAAAGPAAASAPQPPAPVAAAPAPSPTPVPADRTDPRTATATLDIPAIGVGGLRIVPYKGTTDDRAGTRVQDRGEAASPYGERGGVGPGEKGNYLVTAHRIVAGGPLRELPSLGKGDSVFVTEGGTVYEYRITGTRTTSFRSAHSLAAQRAEVPGAPGEKPTQAMITVSTCATPEDDAAGNHWRDGNDNPEHRIDKIGVLVASKPS
ncbi:MULTISPECIES: class E sortase [Streptomyces]|uniref:class E sortase n=2 Tax=Streptomyces TaxID=1883 RepID=UPI00048C8081|nr:MULTISPECIES: class E sortase [unclassified Streptomyces]MYY17434.1 sortase [Streptomyces sp. SID4912]SCE34055.1 sortase A [Streptomyces sp. DpondAA-D4]